MPFDGPQETTTEVNHFLPLFNLLSEGPYRFGSMAKKKRKCGGKKEKPPAELKCQTVSKMRWTQQHSAWQNDLVCVMGLSL